MARQAMVEDEAVEEVNDMDEEQCGPLPIQKLEVQDDTLRHASIGV